MKFAAATEWLALPEPTVDLELPEPTARRELPGRMEPPVRRVLTARLALTELKALKAGPAIAKRPLSICLLVRTTDHITRTTNGRPSYMTVPRMLIGWANSRDSRIT